MSVTIDWTIPGAEGEVIFGNSHVPSTDARGVVLIAHGFKGYKDYGMFPRLALACADAGLLAHRFNFSHSGMTDRTESFERTDLFERDTWNKQVFDYSAVIDAVSNGTLGGSGVPFVMFGHSRGGVTALLTAGRAADSQGRPRPAGVVTAAAPARANNFSDDEASTLLRDGFLVSPSARTGQDLRVGRAFLQEQLDDPGSHDVLALVARIDAPMLIVHGEDDPTIPAENADRLATAARHARVLIVPGGDHVFNTVNPMPLDAEPSPQLRQVIDALTGFAVEVSGRGT